MVFPFRLTKIVVAPADGEAAQIIELRGLLQRALQPLGYLVERVLDGRARPDRFDHHRLDDEAWIFISAQPKIGKTPAATATIMK